MLQSSSLNLTLTLTVGLAMIGFSPVSRGDSEITPHWESATLTDDETTINVERVREQWPFEQRIGDLVVRMRDATIEAVIADTDEPRWSATAGIRGDLSYLTERTGVLFVAAGKTYEEEREDTAFPCDIRRLSLENGEWLPAVEIPLDESELAGMNSAIAALALDDGVLLLTITEREGDFDDERLSYRLTKFNDENEVTWSKSFPSGGAVASPSVTIIGTSGPAMDYAAIQHLTLVDGKVLVCAGPMEDIMLLDPADGSSEWTLSRIWEFRKGFIGPSVWEHFIWRFGIDDHSNYQLLTPEEVAAENSDGDSRQVDVDAYQRMQELVAEAQQEAEGETANIVSGPVVVTLDDEYDRFRLFVVTAQSDAPVWSNYLSDCIVYEIDSNGRPHGMLTLPSFVVGEDYHVLDESLFWRCDSGAMARLYPSSVWGADNRTIAMDWSVTRPADEREVWVGKGSYYLTLDYRENFLLIIEEGGFIESRDELHLEFPMSLVDLRTGAKRELIVDVPFEGRVEKPETNVSGGRESWTAYGRYLIDLMEVEFQDDRIAVTFITDEVVEQPEADDGFFAEPEYVRHQLIFDAGAILADPSGN